MTDELTSLNQIITFRKEKLQKLKEMGVNPYPHSFNPTHSSHDILTGFDSHKDQDVIVAGRILSVRKMGKAAFCHILDQTGRIQIYIRRDDVGSDNYDQFKLLDIGDFIGVNGFVFRTKTGEISVHAKSLTVLAKSIRPLPIVKEKEGVVFDAFTDKENRYRNRHLDLIVNPDVRTVFIKRAKIISAIRKHMDRHNYIEVETPVLQSLYGGANARPFQTHHNTLDEDLYLRIALELYLKRLIIGGFDRVYELSKVFRNEGMDRNHNPEFTMLEFYQAYADYNDMMEFVENLIQTTAGESGSLQLKWGDLDINLEKPFRRITLFELLNEHLNKDISEADDRQLKLLCADHNLTIPDNATYGQLLDELMKRLVEPDLVQPTFVIDYPKAISPLAKTHRSGNNELVERFELFIGGMEFANAFTELNDPADQRDRFESQAELRKQGDEEAQLVDDNFIQAMECGMPPTGGVGIGIDRLVMLLTGQRWIKDVILFPALRSQ